MSYLPRSTYDKQTSCSELSNHSSAKRKTDTVFNQENNEEENNRNNLSGSSEEQTITIKHETWAKTVQHISSRFFKNWFSSGSSLRCSFPVLYTIKTNNTAVDGLLNTAIFYITFYFTSANSMMKLYLFE